MVPAIRRAAIIPLAVALLASCGGGVGGAPGSGASQALPDPRPLETPRLARYGEVLYDGFDGERAMETVRFADRFFRVRGNVGYQRTIAHVEGALLDAGYDRGQVRRLELGPEEPTWTPVSARLELVGEEGPVTLHGFADETGRDRATLLVRSDYTPAAELEVVLATSAEDVRGRVVLGRGHPRQLFDEHVVQGGAAGILTVFLMEVHEESRQPDVAQFGYLPPFDGRPAFGFSISPRSDRLLRAAIEEGWGRATIRVAIDVKVGTSRATTLEATIPGASPGAPAVVLVAHVDEPGAHDNGSGVAAQLELARALRAAVDDGALPPFEAPIVMLWGQEIECPQEWIGLTSRPVRAALVLDMVGGDPETVGAPFLIERMPDPGAIWLRPPDESQGWGGSPPSPESLRGHFLNDYFLAAVSLRASAAPGWEIRSHPFEGGSDHVPFLLRGVPAVLAWHYPDSAYHTSLDRAERVSGEEMRRVASSAGATAVGLASFAEEDRGEMLAAAEHGAHLRLSQVLAAARTALGRGGDPELERRIVRAWVDWYDEALLSVSDGDEELLRLEVQSARDWLAAAGARLLEQLPAPRPR